MAYKTTASLNKLTYIDYVGFGKSQDRFGRFSWSKIDSYHLEIKLKVFKKDDNEEFRLVQSLTMGEVGFFSVYSIEESAGQCSRKFC